MKRDKYSHSAGWRNNNISTPHTKRKHKPLSKRCKIHAKKPDKTIKSHPAAATCKFIKVITRYALANQWNITITRMEEACKNNTLHKKGSANIHAQGEQIHAQATSLITAYKRTNGMHYLKKQCRHLPVIVLPRRSFIKKQSPRQLPWSLTSNKTVRCSEIPLVTATVTPSMPITAFIVSPWWLPALRV